MDDWRTEFRSMAMQEGAGRVDSMTVESILGGEIAKERCVRVKQERGAEGCVEAEVGKGVRGREVCFSFFFFLPVCVPMRVTGTQRLCLCVCMCFG